VLYINASKHTSTNPASSYLRAQRLVQAPELRVAALHHPAPPRRGRHLLMLMRGGYAWCGGVVVWWVGGWIIDEFGPRASNRSERGRPSLPFPSLLTLST
jgi:hypothetical protein